MCATYCCARYRCARHIKHWNSEMLCQGARHQTPPVSSFSADCNYKLRRQQTNTQCVVQSSFHIQCRCTPQAAWPSCECKLQSACALSKSGIQNATGHRKDRPGPSTASISLPQDQPSHPLAYPTRNAAHGPTLSPAPWAARPPDHARLLGPRPDDPNPPANTPDNLSNHHPALQCQRLDPPRQLSPVNPIVSKLRYARKTLHPEHGSPPWLRSGDFISQA